MALPDKTVDDLLKLAALTLDPAERLQLKGQLETILEYIDQLAAIDTAGVPATTTPVDVGQGLREDELEPSLSPDEALRSAPARHGDFFEVPAVLGDQPS